MLYVQGRAWYNWMLTVDFFRGRAGTTNACRCTGLEGGGRLSLLLENALCDNGNPFGENTIMNAMRMACAVCVVAFFGVASVSTADQPAALAKLSAADAAIAAGKGPDAAAALNELAATLAADAAGTGDYAVAIASWQADDAKECAGRIAREEKLPAAALGVMSMRVKDLYGALMPAGRGDLGAAATYVKGLGAGSSDFVKGKLNRAADQLTEAAAGKADKAAALALMRVTLYSTVPLGKMIDLVNVQDHRASAIWLRAAVGYLRQEEQLADEAGAASIHDALGGMGALAEEVAGGRPLSEEEIKEILNDFEQTVVDVSAKPASGAAEKE